MIFTTTIFLFVFLPLFLIGYFLLPFKYRSMWILFGSWVFYGWWRVDFLALMIAVTIWTYLLGNSIEKRRLHKPAVYASSASLTGKNALIFGVCLNIGVLAYFKYFNFGVDTVNSILKSMRLSPITAWNVILPIGISFYIFQATSYLIDIYRTEVPAAGRYVDLAAYISLFPQLIAGPIIRYKDINYQIAQREHSWDKFSQGSLRFMLGFSKKVLIADTVAILADRMFALSSPTFVESWLGAVAFMVQIYFDFSAYSDMAIGLGLMMGFRFPENFNHPYIAKSITEFWKRWHISLSTWLRDYLYIPLGGNRKGLRRTYVNLMMVMVIGGLWHGAAWSFAAWGTFHGIILVVERFRRSREIRVHVPGPVSIILTLCLVILGWVVFRAETFRSALNMYAGMAGLNGIGIAGTTAWQLNRFAVCVLVLALVIIFTAPRIAYRIQDLSISVKRRVLYAQFCILPLFVISMLKIIADSYSPFLYFQF